MEIVIKIIILAVVLFPNTNALANQQTDLLGAKSFIETLNQATEGEQRNKGLILQPLLKDIQTYAKSASTLDKKESSEQWTELLIRSSSLTRDQIMAEMDAIDPSTSGYVSAVSVLHALPSPDVWKKFEYRNNLNDPIQVHGVNLLLAILKNDQSSISSHISALKKHFSKPENSMQYRKLDSIYNLEDLIAERSGDKKKIVDLIMNQLNDVDGYRSIELPDLVNIIGEKEATNVITKVLTESKVSISVDKGQNTLRLAKNLAVQLKDKLKIAHWGLVKGLDSAELYEALDKRFKGDQMSTWLKDEAQIYYLWSLIAEKKIDKANEFASQISSQSGNIYISKDIVNQMIGGGYSDEVYKFLNARLKKEPLLPLWRLYVQLAVTLGYETEMISLIEHTISKTLQNENIHQYMEEQLISAYLAIGDTGLKKAIKKIHDTIKAGNKSRKFKYAIKLAQLGHQLKKPQWVKEGLSIASQSVETQITGQNVLVSDEDKDYINVLLENGKYAIAEKYIIDKLVNYIKILKGYASTSQVPIEGFLMSTLSEPATILIGIYAAAEKWNDITILLDEFPYFGSEDVRNLLLKKDSRKKYIGVHIAKALENKGRVEDALKVSKAILSRNGGIDDVYEITYRLLGSDFPTYMDALYAEDQFEERPLIWKAKYLLNSGKYKEAENTANKAISIDPSDGEQGEGDRMRVYSIMGEIQEKLGNPEGRDFNQSAVRAIRLSEEADKFEELGLHKTAIKMYKQASEIFENAYCVQSRLAIQLTNRGQYDLAVKHYRKAYELMPDSFGRVESHCFGCENVFSHPKAQGIAEQVFTQMLDSDPMKPQVHYMMGYLKKEQNKPNEAIKYFRKAVALDPLYLNAWKQQNEIGKNNYMEGWESDIAALKMLELDLFQRHVKVDLSNIGDLEGLWQKGEEYSEKFKKMQTGVMSLPASKALMSEGSSNSSNVRNALYKLNTGNKISTPGAYLLKADIVNLPTKLLTTDIRN